MRSHPRCSLVAALLGLAAPLWAHPQQPDEATATKRSFPSAKQLKRSLEKLEKQLPEKAQEVADITTPLWVLALQEGQELANMSEQLVDERFHDAIACFVLVADDGVKRGNLHTLPLAIRELAQLKTPPELLWQFVQKAKSSALKYKGDIQRYSFAGTRDEALFSLHLDLAELTARHGGDSADSSKHYEKALKHWKRIDESRRHIYVAAIELAHEALDAFDVELPEFDAKPEELSPPPSGTVVSDGNTKPKPLFLVTHWNGPLTSLEWLWSPKKKASIYKKFDVVHRVLSTAPKLRSQMEFGADPDAFEELGLAQEACSRRETWFVPDAGLYQFQWKVNDGGVLELDGIVIGEHMRGALGRSEEKPVTLYLDATPHHLALSVWNARKSISGWVRVYRVHEGELQTPKFVYQLSNAMRELAEPGKDRK